MTNAATHRDASASWRREPPDWANMGVGALSVLTAVFAAADSLAFAALVLLIGWLVTP